MGGYCCPECGRDYQDAEMLAGVSPDERPWYGRLIRAWGRHPEHGLLRGYQWHCGCDAICFCPWGNEFVRLGLPGQPQPFVVGHLGKKE